MDCPRKFTPAFTAVPLPLPSIQHNVRLPLSSTPKIMKPSSRPASTISMKLTPDSRRGYSSRRPSNSPRRSPDQFQNSDYPTRSKRSQPRRFGQGEGMNEQVNEEDEDDNESISFPKSDPEDQGTSTPSEDTGIADVDDSVDDGFFSRYRREANIPIGRDPFQPPTPSRSPHVSRQRQTQSKANQQAASIAFDAVDKLFGSMNVGEGPSVTMSPRNRQPYESNPSMRRSARETRNPRRRPSSADGGNRGMSSTQNPPEGSSARIDRTTWLENVKARAATTTNAPAAQRQAGYASNSRAVDDNALDVDAVEDVSSDSLPTEEDDAEDENERGVGSDDDDNSLDEGEDGEPSTVSAGEVRGDYAVGGDVASSNVQNDKEEQRQTRGIPQRQSRSSGSPSMRRRGSRGDFYDSDDDDEYESDEKNVITGVTPFPNSAFDTLMRLARQGPVDSRRGSRRKLPRSPRPANTTTTTTTTPPVSEGGSGDGKPEVSRLLGLTKQIISSQRDRGRRPSTPADDDDYEPLDDEMKRVVTMKGKVAGSIKRMRNQRYSAVRRAGGQTRRVLLQPDEWRPLTDQEVSKVASDGRSLRHSASDSATGGNRRSNGVISDCVECNGTGLEMCAICLGEGWVQPLRGDTVREVDSTRLGLLRELWSEPNLVVDLAGEAQCIRCNSMGKQLCGTCKGSGSSLHKGFSIADRNKVFDLFGAANDGPRLDDIDFERDVDDVDEDAVGEGEEDENSEIDSFQLYRGSAASFDFFGKKGLRKDGQHDVGKDRAQDISDADADDGDDVIEVEDESGELLATLEAMHVADLEERRPSLDERLGIRRKPPQDANSDDGDDDLIDEDDDAFELEDDDISDELVEVEENEEVDDKYLELAGDDDDDENDGFEEVLVDDGDVVDEDVVDDVVSNEDVDYDDVDYDDIGDGDIGDEDVDGEDVDDDEGTDEEGAGEEGADDDGADDDSFNQ